MGGSSKLQKLERLAHKANNSRFYKWALNKALWRVVPFNKPHGLSVDYLNADKVVIGIPFIRANKNHLNTLHACVMATAGEYASGLFLLLHAKEFSYRLIMSSLHVDYHFRGEMAAGAHFSLSPSEIEDKVIGLMRANEVIELPCTVQIMDTEQNKLATVHAHWQLKPWNKVKSKKS